MDYQSQREYANSLDSFYTKGGLAYTEDHVVVYNIFVHKIPKEITESAFKQYFQTYGNVTRCNLQSANGIGFIDYENPNIVVKVLQQRHKLCGIEFFVKAAYSWLQPNASFTNSSSDNMMDTIQDNSNDKTLLHLNDDCLELICKKLLLKDEINFARVCQKFQTIFQMCSRVKYNNLNFAKLDGLTMWEKREFFRLIGSGLEFLHGEPPEKDPECVIDAISKHCNNVKKMRITSYYIRKGVIYNLISCNPNLIELHLEGPYLDDNELGNLRHLTNLQTLILKYNLELTGKNLKMFTNVKILNLFACRNIQSAYLIEALESLQSLTRLDIRHCDHLTSNVYNAMVKSCQNLEELKVPNTDSQYQVVANLPKLKHLELFLQHRIRREIFVELVEKKSKQLEFLRLGFHNYITLECATLIGKLEHLKYLHCIQNVELDYRYIREFSNLLHLEEIDVSYCSRIHGYELLELLGKCKALRRIKVQNCVQIKSDFIIGAIQVLKERIDEIHEPIIFFVKYSGISKRILSMDEEYCEVAGKLVILNYTYPIMDHKISYSKYMDSLTDEDSLSDGHEYGFDFYGALDDSDYYDGRFSIPC